MNARLAISGDAAALAAIYNAGLADRMATFETRPRSAAEVQAWLLSRRTKPIARAQHPDVTKRHSRPVKGQDRAR